MFKAKTRGGGAGRGKSAILRAQAGRGGRGRGFGGRGRGFGDRGGRGGDRGGRGGFDRGVATDNETILFVCGRS